MGDETDTTPGGRSQYLRLGLRIGIAGLVLGPGVSKILTYDQSVQFFRTLGLPSPDLLVPIVAGIELLAAGLLLLDRRPRVAGALVVPVMLVAAATAGPTWQNLGVLAAAVLLIAVETTGWNVPRQQSTG
jgi:uncharacterized membrane protein YphA (DoxX/SURF4 family)